MNNNYQFAVVTNGYQEPKNIASLLKKKLKSLKVKENNLNPDIVFVIGGDGTFLKAVHKYNKQLDKVKFVPFKEGKIGFYYNFSTEKMDQVIKEIYENNKKIAITELDLLEVEFNNEIVYAINEFRLINFSQTLGCEVYLNNKLLQFFSGSGIIISTKTGTTGLMKSAGGAIILANKKLMEYQELFAINNNNYQTINAPIIFDDSQVISLKLKNTHSEKTNSARIVIDTFDFCDKLVGEVKVKISKQPLKIFSYKTDDNFLINKLTKYFIKF